MAMARRLKAGLYIGSAPDRCHKRLVVVVHNNITDDQIRSLPKDDNFLA